MLQHGEEHTLLAELALQLTDVIGLVGFQLSHQVFRRDGKRKWPLADVVVV
jgi:hypothetical protein